VNWTKKKKKRKKKKITTPWCPLLLVLYLNPVLLFSLAVVCPGEQRVASMEGFQIGGSGSDAICRR
jgi:hypothetical protein